MRDRSTDRAPAPSLARRAAAAAAIALVVVVVAVTVWRIADDVRRLLVQVPLSIVAIGSAWYWVTRTGVRRVPHEGCRRRMMIWEEAERISGTSSMVTLPTVLHRTMLPIAATPDDRVAAEEYGALLPRMGRDRGQRSIARAEA